jgi:hypothetical protein
MVGNRIAVDFHIAMYQSKLMVGNKMSFFSYCNVHFQLEAIGGFGNYLIFVLSLKP